jgi:GNAT superfamily N-acetyltransferase
MKLSKFQFWQNFENAPAERTIRPISIDDLPAYRLFVSALSAQSKYQRTLGGAVMPSEAQFIQLLSPKPGLDVVLGVLNGTELVAVGRYAFVQKSICEFALTVADRWQGMGLGTSLLKQLKVDAAKAGYEQMVASVFATNVGMLSLGQSQGFQALADAQDATLRKLQCALLPTAALLKAPTPKITPIMRRPIPTALNQPGIVDLHK